MSDYDITITIPNQGPPGPSGNSDFSGRKILYVSKGDAATDARGGLNKYDALQPFATLGAAKNAAAYGDVIVVEPGTYNERDLLKNGVDWHFQAGAIVHYVGTTPGAIWDDTSTGADGAVVSNITGYGVFNQGNTGDNEDPAVEADVIKIGNANSDVSIFALKILNTRDTEFSASQSGAVSHLNGTLRVTAGVIASDQGSGATWYDGPGWVRANQIRGALAAIYVLLPESPSGGNWYVQADLVESAKSGAVEVIGSPTNASRQWIFALDMIGTSASGTEGTVKVEAGNVYITSQRVRAINGRLLNVSGGKLWLQSEKLFYYGDSTVSGGDSWIEAQHGEWANGSSFTITNGNVRIIGVEDITGTTNTAAYLISSLGSVRFRNVVINALASTNPPMQVSGSNAVILDNVTLLAPSGSDSISANASRNVVIYNARANRAASANVVPLVGTLTVSTDVQ
jgi:hypothetical protein